MYGIFLSAARYMLILFFGVFASAAIADIRLNKKNLLILIVFYICNCLIQLVILLTDNIQHVILYYPVITHLPLFLLFVLIFKNIIRGINARCAAMEMRCAELFFAVNSGSGHYP